MQSGTAAGYVWPNKKQIFVSGAPLGVVVTRKLTTQDLNGLIIVDSTDGQVILELPPANTIRAGGYFQILALTGNLNQVTVRLAPGAGDTYNTGNTADIVLSSSDQELLVLGMEASDRWLIPLAAGVSAQRAAGVQTFTFGHPPEDSIASSVQLVAEQVNGMGVITKTQTQVNTIQMSLLANALDPGATQDITVGIYSDARTLLAQSNPVTYSSGNPPSPTSATPAAALQTFPLQSPITLDAGRLYYLFVHAAAVVGVSAATVFFYQTVQPASLLTIPRWASNNQPVPPPVIPFPGDFAFSTTTQWMQAIWL